MSFRHEASVNSRIALAIEDRETGFESPDVAFQSQDVVFQTQVSLRFNSISGRGLRDQDNYLRSLKTNEQLVKSWIVNKQLICLLTYTH